MSETTNDRERRVAELVFAYGQYILTYPELRLEVRGKYPEWVFSAAWEIIRQIEAMKLQNGYDAARFAHTEDEVDEMEIEFSSEISKYKMESRLDVVPQCSVTYDGEDYRWVAPRGREKPDEPVISRIYDPHIGTAGPAV